jgi:regulator of sigma E protease
MKMGAITSVQVDSPAAIAGIQPGDEIQQIDGQPIGDPMRLPDQLNRRVGQTVAITILKASSKSSLVVPVKLRQPRGFWSPDIEQIPRNVPVEISALGITYRVLNEVQSVTQECPAAKAGMQPGDVIVKAKLIPPGKDVLQKFDAEQEEATIPFNDKEYNWPATIMAIQKVLPGTRVELTYSRQGKNNTVTLEPVDSHDCFNPDRGFRFEPMMFESKAETVREAVGLGGQETLGAVTIVFRSVKKLSTNEVSPRQLAGPILIFKMALYKADQGTSALLLFLTLLSANLAVINFLPIPVLDGGLFVLLLYEGIRGKPANERVHEILSYIGLTLILALMFWVLGLDFGLISRH